MNEKILIVIAIVLLSLDVSKLGPVARLSTRASFNQPEPSLTVGLLPPTNATQTPTPYPTPRYDPSTFIPPIPRGKTVTVKGPNLADKIQTAQDDSSVAIVKIEGGGSVSKQVTLRKYTVFDSSTYSCDMQGITDQGQFLLADGVRVEGTWRLPKPLIDYFKFGKGTNWQDPYLEKVQALTAEQLAGTGTTILEPAFVNGTVPAIEVFQALGDSVGSHTDAARDIAVIGFHIKGRQKVYDGGVRSTILLGNCVKCTAQNNYLEDTGSIGVQFGGSALEKNNYSNQGLIWHNIASGVAAANFAAVNSENLLVVENYVRRPGHHDPVFGGGVCGFDLEPNSAADHSVNIGVYNNLFDYEEAAREGVGNALCLQNPYPGTNHGKVTAANNIAIGGRGEHSNHRYLSNGIFLVGLAKCEVIDNYVFRTGQNAFQAYALNGCIIQDNDFESTGGGGNSTVLLNNVTNTIVRRNHFRSRPGLTINVQAGIVDKCGKSNVIEDNRVNGEATNQPASVCP